MLLSCTMEMNYGSSSLADFDSVNEYENFSSVFDTEKTWEYKK